MSFEEHGTWRRGWSLTQLFHEKSISWMVENGPLEVSL